MDHLKKALERAGGSQKLAELLVSVVSQFVTPQEDPIYDWQIVPLSAIAGAKQENGLTWAAALPEEITTGAWSAPARQCALAWGTRLPLSRFHEQGDVEPSPVAVLVRAVRDGENRIQAEIGATFFYSPGDERRAPTWFRQRGSTVDPQVSTLIIGYLNSRSTPTARPAEGVDLD
ncbi:MAG: hypothetical protein KatS3mg023_3645 [Armatimonadota bacterium]|jgi:hypothetical protein|nr:MAG: hypothetical protein KatS3mg023_3645 [Armatimonadota bacterium]